MIDSIEVSKEASFGDQPQVLSGLTRINYVFGANATGKTTISRIAADPSWSFHCQVRWSTSQPLETLVYNKDFITRNFEETDRLKGIFTLGEEHISVRKKIEAAKKEHEDLVREVDGLTNTLEGDDGSGGKRGELRQVDDKFRSRCWAQKQKHDEVWAGAFSGYRNSQDNFMAKILEEAGDNQAALRPLEELLKRADTVFGPAPLEEPILSSPDFSGLLGHEKNPILALSVVGASDVRIASLIERLGSSDWVRRGRKYLKKEPTACPFCQQEPPNTLESDLENYFDEEFEEQTGAITDLVAAYRKDAAQAVSEVEGLEHQPSRYLDKEKLSPKIALLQSIVDKNLATLEAKEEEPSRKVELDSVQELAAAVTKLVQEANAAADTHNKTVANLSVERERLRGEVWRYILDEELAEDIESYEDDRGNLRKAIESLESQIKEKEAEQARKLREIEQLERNITSVQDQVRIFV